MSELLVAHGTGAAHVHRHRQASIVLAKASPSPVPSTLTPSRGQEQQSYTLPTEEPSHRILEYPYGRMPRSTIPPQAVGLKLPSSNYM